jgi:hypothetical protein
VSKSLEQRIYEAYHKNRGMHLTAEDVESLVSDDAVATRITNAACTEADLLEAGSDCIRSHESWEEFKERLILQSKQVPWSSY